MFNNGFRYCGHTNILEMTKEEFEKHRLEWLKDWSTKYRLMDIDFEMYMLMKGVSPDEYKRLNEMPDGDLNSDDCMINKR